MKFKKIMILFVSCLISMTVQTAFAQEKTVFVNVNILPMNEEVVLQNHSVIVENERITAIARESRE